MHATAGPKRARPFALIETGAVSRYACRAFAMTFAPKLPAYGAEIPAIGFGTSRTSGEVTAEQVAAALKAGYRHIDTARKYGTEGAVGEGMRASGVPRSEIFLCTKVSHENLHANDFARSVDESLKALGVDYVDLLLVHWPEKNTPLAETMGALAKAKRQGLTRHIGVANFNIAMLDEAIRLCPEPLVTLQAECHPYLDQAKVIAACRARGLVLTAYCPLSRGRLRGDPVLTEIAERKSKTFAQVALRWLMQQRVVAAIPHSTNAERIGQNIDVFDFTLDDDEMRRIDALKRADGRTANPVGRAPQWD
jgi:diketogulonate reductase-like aldo/keto reductase